LSVDDVWSPELSVLIGSEGGVFLDLTAEQLDQGGQLEIATREEDASQDLRHRLLGFADYPAFCMDPVDLPTGDATTSVEIPSGCDFLTLQTANTHQDDYRRAFRSARFTPGEPNLLVNGSFGTGDLSGWMQFETEPPPPAVSSPTQFEVVASPDAVDGNFVARGTTTDGGPDGLSQTVAVSRGWYEASAWMFDVNGTKDFLLEVYDSQGALIAAQAADFPLAQEWQELAVEFYTDSPTVTFRLTCIFFFSESATFRLDDARLVASEDPDGNFGFEEGTLEGWSLVNSGDGGFDVAIVTPGLDGGFAAEVTSTGAPEDGLVRVIDPGSRACVITALASGNTGSEAVLEVSDTETGLLVRDSYTFTGTDTEPILLVVEPPLSFFPETDVTVRLLYSDATSSTAVVLFDELEVQYCT
jgi:hypothetical protein